jgi:hypothetical protein
VPGQCEVDPCRDQFLDVGLGRFADLAAVGYSHLNSLGHLAVAVRLLLAEADAEPGIDERRLRWKERVMPRVPLLDPAGGRVAVEVARVLRLLDRVAGELTQTLGPHTRKPAGRRSRSRPGGRRGRGQPLALVAPRASSPAAPRRGLWRLVEGGSRARCRVPSRQQPGRVLQLVGKRHELEPAHAT